jgi:hypothetical protein
MASKSRIDEFQTLRMFVFKKERYGKRKKRKYYGRPMRIIEREKLMGYPVGYIQKPGKWCSSVMISDALSSDARQTTHSLACAQLKSFSAYW